MYGKKLYTERLSPSLLSLEAAQPVLAVKKATLSTPPKKPPKGVQSEPAYHAAKTL